MEKKFFNDEIKYLEKYLGHECIMPGAYLEKYDHFTNQRFHEIILFLRDTYRFENGKHFPTIGDFEIARQGTQIESTFKQSSDSDIEKSEYSKIVLDLADKFRVKDLTDRKKRLKEYHDNGQIFSYVEMRYVNKISMPDIGGKFKDTFTNEIFDIKKI